MKRTLLMIGLASALLACGGGGDGDGGGGGGGGPLSMSLAGAGALELSEKKAAGTVPAQLPGDPASRSVGQLQNGGHVVAWVSGLDAYLQRYNKPGKAMGEAIRLPIPQDLPDYMSPPSVVVQTNGDVAVVYQRVRPSTVVDPTFPEPANQHIGVYLQRFAANGNQLQGELEIVSMHRWVPGARQELQELRTLALSDGSFVVSWGLAYRGGLGATQTDYFMQRFDGSGVPAGKIIVPVKNYWCANRYQNSTFEWDADETGGFSVTGTIYPKQFDGEDQCGGYGPPVERQVYTYYAGAQVPAASKQAKRKACTEAAVGLKGQERKAKIDSCIAR